MTEGATGSTHVVYPSLLLAQGEKRNFGGVDVEFILSNDAHSPGDVLMWLPEQKIMFGGDVLSSQWMPILTYHGNVPHLIDTLYEVAKLNPEIVLTGHGKATSGKSIKRDADLVSGVWKLVKEGYQYDKKPTEIILDVNEKLGPLYKSQYDNFDSEIKRYVELMYKRQQ
jgi:glyoxylase-like metal-dependent hydrolase (beta-lactamase superfamily II)